MHTSVRYSIACMVVALAACKSGPREDGHLANAARPEGGSAGIDAARESEIAAVAMQKRGSGDLISAYESVREAVDRGAAGPALVVLCQIHCDVGAYDLAKFALEPLLCGGGVDVVKSSLASDAKAWGVLGLAYEKLFRWTRAIAAYRVCKEMGGGPSALGDLEARISQLRGAQEALLVEAESLRGREAEKDLGSAYWLRRIQIAIQLGDLDAAEEIAARWCERVPRMEGSLAGSVYVLAERGRHEEAMALLESVLGRTDISTRSIKEMMIMVAGSCGRWVEVLKLGGDNHEAFGKASRRYVEQAFLALGDHEAWGRIAGKRMKLDEL